LHLRLGLGLGQRERVASRLNVDLRLRQRGVGRRDIFGAAARTYLVKRALGGVAGGPRLRDLRLQLLWVVEKPSIGWTRG